MKSALFRVDGSHHLGLGHIMRCLAFAQGLGKVGLESIFIVKDYEQRVTQLIQHHGYDVETIPRDSSFTEDASLTSEFASRYGVSLIVTDLSHDENIANLEEYNRYFQALKAAHKFMITIDDFTKTDFPHDIQIIPYCGAENMSHESRENSKLLLGPDYVIFRQEFIEVAKVHREIRKDAQNILVTMGGSDLLNLTIKVAKALTRLNVTSLKLQIIIGPGFETLVKSQVEKVLEGYRGNYELLMGSDNMADLMLWADLAITGGGLTKYETAVTGTPTIIISQIVREAERNREFEKEGTALHLGLGSEVEEQDIVEAVEKLLGDYALRVEMAERGRNLVDGKGIERIISEIPNWVLS